jgi:hypothetical protein
MYSKAQTPSLAISIKSLPEPEAAVGNKELESTSKDRIEYLALRTRSKKNFR